MHPILFDEFGSYGTLILIGTTLTIPGVRWDARARGVPKERLLSFIVDFYLVLMFGAFFGGRLFHVLTVPGTYAAEPMKLFTIDGTGFVFFGSLVATGLGWIWLARRYGLAVSSLCDLGLTWMGLGHAFGRAGCLMAGCCWGAPTNASVGLEFPAYSVVYLERGAPLLGDSTLPLHPTQIYEAVGLLAIWAVLLGLRSSRDIEAPWRMSSRYLVAYGILRFIGELMRGDPTRGYLVEGTAPWLAQLLALPPNHPVWLTFSQLVALGLIALGGYGLRVTATKDPPDRAATSAQT